MKGERLYYDRKLSEWEPLLVLIYVNVNQCIGYIRFKSHQLRYNGPKGLFWIDGIYI